MSELISINSKKINVDISEQSIDIISKISRGVPRLANNFLEWIRDYGVANGLQGLTSEQVTRAVKMQGIDENGLNPIDRKYLDVLTRLPKGTHIGVNTLCSALSLDRQTIEQKIEPYLMQQGYVNRTSKGRVLIKGL